MSTNDGGPAFPSGMLRKIRQRPGDPGSNFILHEKTESVETGMSLRDWFAGMALQGLNANPNLDLTNESTASVAYGQADAMLKARETR